MNLKTTRLVISALALVISMVSSGQEAERSEGKPTFAEPTLDERFLFLPTKYPSGNWKPEGLKFQDVFFESSDGTKLHGWYCPAEDPRAVMLYAHGNAGHVAARAPWLRYLQKEARVSVFLYDYRGYGRSEGVPTVMGALHDSLAARAKLAELADIKETEMFLMGESLGGAMMVQLAAISPPRGLILQSTFSSLRDAAQIHYPALAGVVPPNKLNSHTKIAKVDSFLFQSHGTADRTIPLHLGEKLFKAAKEPKEFYKIKGAGHNNWLTKEYLQKLDAFIDRVNKESL